MRIWTLWGSLVATLLLATLAPAQANWDFRLFPTPQGIPVGEVNALLEDHEGALWIATWGNGVYRVQDTDWRVFNEANGLVDDWTCCLAEDGAGVVWIGTADALCRVRNDEVEVFTPQNTPALTGEFIRTMTTLRDGSLLIGGDNGQILRHSYAPAPSEPHAPIDIWEPLPYERITQGQPVDRIVELPSGALWVALEERGIVQYFNDEVQIIRDEPRSWSITQFEPPSQPHQIAMGHRHGNTLLHATGDGEITEEIVNIPNLATLEVSAAGVLYAGTLNGVVVREKGSWRPMDLGREVGNPDIKDILFSRNGTLWLGTREGVAQGLPSSWARFSKTSEDIPMLAMLGADNSGSPLLAVAQGNRVVRFEDGQWNSMKQLQDRRHYSKWHLFSPFDTIWALETRSHITEFSLETGEVLRTKELPSKESVQLFQTSDDIIWALTGAGIFALHDNKWEPIPRLENYARRGAYAALELEPNVFLIGLKDGIERWDGDQVTYYGKEYDIPTDDAVHTICVMENGEIWFGSFGSGIYIFDGKKFRRFDQEDGLPDNSVSNIIQAKDGTIWISLYRTGVASFRDGRWVAFSHQQGLPNSSVNRILESPKGNIWLSTRNSGLLAYRPTKKPPQTHIDIKPESIPNRGMGVFSFSGWDAWNRTMGPDLLFSWRVTPKTAGGNSTDWTTFSPITTVVSPSLKPGTYQFEVRASDEDRNVDPIPAVAKFKVMPPFWQSWSFLLPLMILAVIAVAAIATGHYMRKGKQQSEKEQRKLDERFKMATANITGAIYHRVCDEEWTTRFISNAIESITGYPAAEFMENSVRSLATLVHSEDKDVIARLNQVPEHDKSTFEAEYRITDAAGQIRWLSDKGRISLDPETRRWVADGALFDETQIKEAQREKKHLELQLAQSRKMDAIGQLAGGIAHDFNNLLTAIQGYADLLLEDLPPESPHVQDVEEIQKAGKRAAELTQKLLTFSRKQVTQPKALNINDTILEVQRLLKRVIGENIDLLTRIEETLGHIPIDPGQLEQILINLAINARDAMPTGGTLTIAASNRRFTTEQVTNFDTIPPGEYVALQSVDTGTGMAPEIMSHLFEPFFTTKERGKGTGLGLATVYGIVRQHNGYIDVESEEGKGSSFTVLFPRTAATTEKQDASTATDEVLHNGTETILVAEDDQGVRGLACRILVEHGYTVLEAQDGENALKIARSHPSEIDLLITDVIMPRMDGNQLANTLTKFRPQTRVLFISGYQGNVLSARRKTGIPFNFLPKPFTPEALTKKVREVLERAQGGAAG
jgi:signal transduction histidine kinase/ligand-binding sensor domain-containing protein/CheY-like chemotaxis protein